MSSFICNLLLILFGRILTFRCMS